MLQVANVTKKFNSAGSDVTAVSDISFSVETGDFASIIGKSGSGKSTLLSLLGGLDQPSNGSIEIDGKDIARLGDHALIDYRCKRIGFVFQNYNLIPNLSALENVMLPMEFAGTSKRSRRVRASELLNQVGITDEKQSRKPGRLSGGEQQRVSIARALANNPSLILADEPTGNLDTHASANVRQILHDLTRQLGTTVIAVTHDVTFANAADRRIGIVDGQIDPEWQM